MTGSVVVGYDETTAGERALVFAAHEAALYGVPLEIVNLIPVADRHSSSIPAHELAEWIADEGERTAHELHPELSVQTHPAAGRPDVVLADQAHEADLLVLGDRSDREYGAWPDGAATVRILDRATCPVAVLSPVDRGPWCRMTAAVDLEEPDAELFAFAFAEAARRHAHLRVVNVCDRHTALDHETFDEDEDEARADASIVADHVQRLEQSVATWRALHPQVACDIRVLTESIGQALIEETCDGDLLVVGGHRHIDGRPGMEVGPAVHALLHHAECPVVVVPIG